MEIAVLAVGRLKAGPARELCDLYLNRARKGGRDLGWRGFDVTEIPESRATRPADRIAGEAKALLSALQQGTETIGLDSGGELLDSPEFAAALSRKAAAAVPRITFVIGGPDGLGPDIMTRADRRLSFGKVTWPHQIVRILLAEQLYRATTILSGHPYHRA